MPKKMLIDATHAEETRVVVVDGNKVEEFDFESLNKRQLAGNIYLAKVTRVEPSLQAAFVDYGGNRHGFLAFSEIHPDYYQIPKADREALLAEEAALDRAEVEEEDQKPKAKSRGRGRARNRSTVQASADGAASTGDDVLVADAPEENGSTLVEDLPEHAGPMEAEKTTPAPAPDEPSAATGDVPTDTLPKEDVTVKDPDQEEVTPETAAKGDTDAEAAAVSEASDPAPDEAPAPLSAEAEADGETPDAAPEDASEDDDTYDTVGADEPREEIAPRRPRARRFKIQEVIKVRQILLVQVVKEERGNKGAALTTYLSLAGRYCVLMPNTARGGGISRKITNAADRKKLKQIANDITVPQGAGLIVRTAGAKRTKTEIKRDYEYLLRQWEQIRDLTLKSIAPTHIYEEGSLIRRSIRDLYNREIDEIFVEGEHGYREAKDYMKMLMPSHAKNVKPYTDMLPLFSRYQVENYLAAMFNPTVQLKSGGYIVIDVTEALVAVDVNSGRSTKEGSIEDTALKTNLEAAEEVARQARLRDLAGLIVIDFIDMDERRNNTAVEKRLKDRLKSDRARIQIGRISGFGLLEMSRQRLRPGMLEASTAPCPHCHGTGRIRSNDSLALAIMRELEEEGVRQRTKEVLVTAPVEVTNYILNAKREHVAMIESRFGLSIRVEGAPGMISPEYKVERYNTATRIVPPAALASPLSTIEPSADLADEDVLVEASEADAPAAEQSEDQPKKRRRRRRRKSSRNTGDDTVEATAEAPPAKDTEAAAAPAAPEDTAPKAADDKKPRSRSRSRRNKSSTAQVDVDSKQAAGADKPDETTGAEQPETVVLKEAEPVADTVVEPVQKEKPKRKPRVRASSKATIDAASDARPEPALTAEDPAAETEGSPKRKGWWSRAIGN
ncbi:MAG: Rne/Rng family ribonuclease [Pseudomonadota bacterium]